MAGTNMNDPQRFSLEKYPFAGFGIVGGFEGDAALESELSWCKEAYLDGTTSEKGGMPHQSPPPLNRLISLLNSLPQLGRKVLAREVLAKSPYRETVLRELFDYCFQGGEDDELGQDEGIQDYEVDDDFVWLATTTSHLTPSEKTEEKTTQSPPQCLNLMKHHLFQPVVLTLIGVCGSTGAQVSREYLDSSSTRYRSHVLARCVTSVPPEDFADNELWEAFCSSPDSVQDKVIETCKRSGHRQDFLRRVHETKSLGDRYGGKLLFWLPTDYVSQHMEKVKRGLGFQRWEAHGDMYVQWIENQLEEHKSDQLKMGKVWQALVPKFQTSGMQKRHVFRLLDMLRARRICVFNAYSYLAPNVKNHLLELSSSGVDVTTFKGVQLAYLEYAYLYKNAPKKDIEKCFRQAVEDEDSETCSAISDLIDPENIPIVTILKRTTLEDLYMHLTGRGVVTRGTEQVDIDPFFGFLMNKDVIRNAFKGDANKISLKKALEVYRAWSELLHQFTPDKLSLEQRLDFFPGKSERNIWASWYNGCIKLFVKINHVRTIIGKLQPNSDSGRQPNFVRFVRYITELFKITLKGFQTASSHMDFQVLYPLLLKDFVSALSRWFDEDNDEALTELRDLLQKALVDMVLPKLDALLDFDPSNASSYINATGISFFSITFSQMPNAGGSDELRSKRVNLLHEMIARASANDGQIALPNGERRFVVVDNEVLFYNHNVHYDAISTAVERMIGMLRDNELNKEMQKRLWGAIVANTPTISLYLERCRSLKDQKKMLMNEERPTIIERSREWLLKTMKKNPHSWKTQFARITGELLMLGVLEDVLTDVSVSSEAREYILREHGGFASEFRQHSLKGATFGPDGSARAEGLIKWLDESINSNSTLLISQAFDFAAARLKTESGLHRRTVFGWLEANAPGRIFTVSMKDRSSNTKALDSLCSSLETIMRNDLSSKDTVSRFCLFRNLPKRILELVLSHPPKDSNQERLGVWIHLAIQISWVLEESMNGSEALEAYAWPLLRTTTIRSSSWIDQTSLAAAQKQSKDPIVIAPFHQSEIQDFNLRQHFGPGQCIAMMESALDAVWDKDFPCVALRVTSTFPEENEECSNALLERLKVLFSICGVAWQESELLTDVFDAIFDTFEEKSVEHSHKAASLLESIIAAYAPDGCWFEVPRLSNACDKVFRFAVRASMPLEKINEWFQLWKQLYTDMGSRVWSQWSVPNDPRTLNFLWCHAKRDKKPFLTRSMLELRQCLLARDLLALSSSSAFDLKEVQDILYSLRQDVLLRMIGGNKTGVIEGTFCPDGVELDDLLYETLDVESLSKFPAAISQRYARFALEKCTGSKSGIHERMEAMQNFVASATTQHVDVLDALQRDMDEAIREALIGRIFTLDSPWHILAFLLSNSVIEKNDQKIMVSLLSNVAKHVHIDKVVGMLEILLREPKRKRLTVQLHRAVVRMLFEHKTPHAIRLLRAEWGHELHINVRALMIEKCVNAVLTNANAKEECVWETSVLESVGRDEDLPMELKMPLFMACAQKCNVPFTLPTVKDTDYENDLALELFSQKMPKQRQVVSDGAVDVFRSVMGEVESHSTGTLQIFARCKKYSLSGLFASKAQSDQKTLQEISDFLLTPVTAWDVVNNFCVDFLSRLLVDGIARRLDQKIYQTPEAKKNAVTKQLCAEICKTCEEAIELKGHISRVIHEVLELPLKERVQRKQHLKSLELILNHSYKQFQRHKGLGKALITEPFKAELDVIQEQPRLFTGISSSLAVL